MAESFVSISLTIKNIPNLSGLDDALSNPSTLMSKLQQIRRVSFFNSMATGKDPSGKSLAPLSPGYAKYKSKKYGRKPIRVASGATQARYDSTVSGNRMTETIDSEVAGYLQSGTSKMPQRKLLPESWEELPSKEQREIERAATDFLDDILESLVN